MTRIVQFPCHDLLVEAAWPGLFIGRDGAYWEVPSSMSVDLASVASDSGPSYHLSMHHNAGLPKLFETEGSESSVVPASLLPGVAVKGAYAFKKNFDIWRSEGSMLKLVIPNDVFLLNPHISASGIIGMTLFLSFALTLWSNDDIKVLIHVSYKKPQVLLSRHYSETTQRSRKLRGATGTSRDSI